MMNAVITEAPPPHGLGEGRPPPGRFADRAFRYVALAAAVLVLVILGLIAYSTVKEAWPWFKAEGLDAVFTDDWVPSQGHFGALGLLYGTALVAVIALVLAVPVSVGIALFTNEIAPRRLRQPMVYVIDLLAAIPSVVFGLWMLRAIAPDLAGVFGSISDATSGIPILKDIFADPSATGLSYATAGIIVAVMITPIVTAISREVMATTPIVQKEAALALGATRWEMIRGSIFPHSRSGIIAAVILGFGRAVGETIAVFLVIGSSQQVSEKIFGPGDTMASVIVGQFGEASGEYRAALIGLGVVLLVMTVIVGAFARGVIRRSNRLLGTAL
jgi:phosphate transport system permease protein